MKKKGILQLTLQLNFWVAIITSNSSYFYVLSVIEQVAWLIIYTMQLIAIQLQLCQNNSFSTTMQFHYNYNHNVIFILPIFIHSLKFGIMKNFGSKNYFPFEVLISILYYDC
jgi:hypothetical protein